MCDLLGKVPGISGSRLQNMLDLTPGNLITHLRKLEDGAVSEHSAGPTQNVEDAPTDVTGRVQP